MSEFPKIDLEPAISVNEIQNTCKIIYTKRTMPLAHWPQLKLPERSPTPRPTFNSKLNTYFKSILVIDRGDVCSGKGSWQH